MRNQKILPSNSSLLIKETNQVEKFLHAVNWDFPQKISYFQNEPRPFNCRKFHWFPATFIPEIPFTLIEILSFPNAIVYDPFSGIGTTFFQALLLGRRPVAVEICSVATEFSKSLLRLFNPKLDQKFLLKSILGELGAFNPNYNYINDIKDLVLIDKLKPWFASNTINQLAFLILLEKHFNDPDCIAGIRITLSSILRTISSQDRGWGCVADNMLPKPSQIKEKDVFEIFTKSIKLLLTSISTQLNYINPNFINIYNDIVKFDYIINGDSRDNSIIPKSSIDLVVTSPPYLNMVDYVTSQRLSYYYLGKDLLEDSNNEIGARHKRRKSDTIQNYVSDMHSVIKNISYVLKNKGYACFVMPSFNVDNENNIIRKKIIDEIILSMTDFGLHRVGEFERVVSNKRRDHNSKWATLEKEKIYIFNKG